MKRSSMLLAGSLTVLLSRSLTGYLSAQPPEGSQWVDRACSYADRFYQWPDYNPRYCNWHAGFVDCANFCSQIANAGCAGMCESNNTNWPDWTGGDCPSYRYYGNYDNYCVDCNGSEYHRVQNYAEWQSWWFWDNVQDWPIGDSWVEPGEQIPYWVGPGNFCFAEWTGGGWHAVYIGAGQGPNARYWAHTNDRHGEYTVTQLLNSGVTHLEFYSSGASPAEALETLMSNEAFEIKAEYEGDVK